MERYGKSTPAVSQDQLKKVFHRFTEVIHGTSEEKFKDLLKIEEEYGIPEIVDMAIEHELSTAKKDAIRDHLNEPQGSTRLLDIHRDRIIRLEKYKAGLKFAREKHLETQNDSKLTKMEDDGRYVNVKSALIYNIKNSECHKGPLALLLMLLLERNWSKKKDKHNTYYYWRKERGYIVASMGHEEMARRLGVCESTIKRYIDALVKNGDIASHLDGRENIYVLGSIDEDGNEHWYCDKTGSAKPFKSEL